MKLGKFLVRSVIGLVLLVIVVVVLTLVYIDSVAKTAIQFGGQQALGVPTEVDKVSIGILSGKASMSGLKVSQPEGFRASHFLSLKEGGVGVTLGSLMSDLVEVPKLELTGLDMYVEKDKNGKANYQVILDNQKKHEAQQQPAPKEEPKEGGKKFVIRELIIRDVTLHAQVMPLGVEKPVIVNVPEIILKDVGTGGQNGVKIDEIINIVMKATFASLIANGKNILPQDMLQDMDKGLKDLNSLASSGVQMVNVVGQQFGGAASQAVGEVNKGIGDIGKGLGGVLGGEKKPNPPK